MSENGKKNRLMMFGAVALVFVVVIGAFLYWYIVAGGLRARRPAAKWEAIVAGRLVDMSIPSAARASKNPLSASIADADAGRALYQKNCEVCHGYDGKGKTAAGMGMYPPAASLSSAELAVRKRTDGEIFYLIRNGIRNTAMPGWSFTDQQTWQLVTYVRHLPETAAAVEFAQSEGNAGLSNAHYVGSESCKKCHAAIYDSWKTTLMANVVRDPRIHPDAVIPDLAKTNALVNFSTNDIAFVYGSKWKQRYFKKIGDDYFPLPAQWDVTHKLWRPYLAKEDWWAKFYPPDNSKRPTSATCDGCHSVNYNVATKTVTEWNVGCEKCHGPGSEHVARPAHDNIVNPARLNFVQANDTCVQCHSQGRPLNNPIDGKYFDWPVGFDMGKNLSAYWKLEDHRLGETTFTHYPDGTAHKNRMQGNDYAQSLMYVHGITCSTCHDPHGSSYNAMLRKPASSLCLDCHGPDSPNGPRAPTIEEHTHHKAGSPGNECVECHMPKIEQTLADVNVRSHTFRFITPAETDAMKIPNACNVCHKDKSTAWVSAALMSWKNASPWRMAN